MGNVAGWKMIHKETRRDVQPGVELLDFRGDEWRLHGVTRYPEGSSTGRVGAVEKGTEQYREFFPSVFDLEIVKDIPREEAELFAQLSAESVSEEHMAALADATFEEMSAGHDGCECTALQHLQMSFLDTLLPQFQQAVMAAVQGGYEFGLREARREAQK